MFSQIDAGQATEVVQSWTGSIGGNHSFETIILKLEKKKPTQSPL